MSVSDTEGCVSVGGVQGVFWIGKWYSVKDT